MVQIEDAGPESPFAEASHWLQRGQIRALAEA